MKNTTCPECKRALNVPEEAVGKRIRCPACRHNFLVPPGADAPAADPEERKPPPARGEEVTPRRKGKKGKKSRQRGDRPRWLLFAAAGAVGCLLLAGVLWLIFRPRGGRGGG